MKQVLLPLAALALMQGNARPADRLDQFVLSQMARRHISGVSLAVVDHGRIVTAGGH